MNGLSHLHGVTRKEHFALALVRGLGGNLAEEAREKFAREVYSMVGEQPPDARRVLDTYWDADYGRLAVYSGQVSTRTCAHTSALKYTFT